MSLAWTLKDEVIRRGKIYYGKLKGSRSFFIAPRLIAQFNTVAGVRRKDEREKLSLPAQKILNVLRKEWEMATADLRSESGVKDRSQFTRAIDELQRVFKVIPSDVVYDPVFTYIWTITEARFPDELHTEMNREQALADIARAYLKGAGVTVRGELARITGLSAPEAGLGNWALVDEGFAVRLAAGVYRLRELDGPLALSANQAPRI